MIKIALSNLGKNGGVEYHRLFVPLGKLAQRYPEQIKVSMLGNIDDATLERLETYDVIVASRYLSRKGDTEAVYAKIKQAGCKLVVDIDDSWELSPRHILRKEWEEKKIGETMKRCLELADEVWTTTPILAEKVKTVNANVRIMKNALDPEDPQWKIDPKPGHRVRIGWSGSRAHSEDIPLLWEPLNYLRSNTDFKRRFDMHYYGYVPGDNWSERFENIFTVNGKWSKYYRRYIAAKPTEYAKGYDTLDAVVIPLADNDFNSCKSELKMLEAGMKKLPVVVSDVYPYRFLINSGVNCIAVDETPAQWVRGIKALIVDPDFRKELGERLHADVMDNYNLETETKKRFEAITALCSSKKQLSTTC